MFLEIFDLHESHVESQWHKLAKQEAGPLDFEKMDAVFEMDQVALLKHCLQWPMKMGTAKLWTVSEEHHSWEQI